MRVYIPQALQRSVRERFVECCAYCRSAEWLTVVTFEFEHVIPRALGGSTTFENLCLSCPMFNRYKSDSASGIDPLTRLEVPLFHPHQMHWTDHFEWSQEGTEILGESAAGRATIDSLEMNRPAVVRARRMWVEMGEHPPTLE